MSNHVKPWPLFSTSLPFYISSLYFLDCSDYDSLYGTRARKLTWVTSFPFHFVFHFISQIHNFFFHTFIHKYIQNAPHPTSCLFFKNWSQRPITHFKTWKTHVFRSPSESARAATRGQKLRNLPSSITGTNVLVLPLLGTNSRTWHHQSKERRQIYSTPPESTISKQECNATHRSKFRVADPRATAFIGAARSRMTSWWLRQPYPFFAYPVWVCPDSIRLPDLWPSFFA